MIPIVASNEISVVLKTGDHKYNVMSAPNSFWRELLDYLPGLYLVFRIDEQEQAQLIFVNQKVKPLLGYNPDEFVLASESDTPVRRSLDRLVDDIAQLSRSGEHHQAHFECELLTRHGAARSYPFDYNLFKAKSGKEPFLVVRVDDKAVGVQSGNTEPVAEDRPSCFVAESQVMQAVMEKIDQLSGSDTNVLLRGEPGTGKRTLARHILRSDIRQGRQVVKPDLVKDRQAEGHLLEQFEEAGEPMVCLVHELTRLSPKGQQAFKRALQQDTTPRIIATSSVALEDAIEQDAFDAELYYMLSFQTVMLPPLRSRPDDIEALVERWVEQSSRVLNLEQFEVTDKERAHFRQSRWEGNFPELYEALRYSLLHSDNGRFRLYQKERAQAGRTPLMEQPDTIGQVVSFEEMNRRYLTRVLELTGGKIYGSDGAAHLLDMKPTTLQSKLKKLDIR